MTHWPTKGSLPDRFRDDRGFWSGVSENPCWWHTTPSTTWSLWIFSFCLHVNGFVSYEYPIVTLYQIPHITHWQHHHADGVVKPHIFDGRPSPTTVHSIVRWSVRWGPHFLVFTRYNSHMQPMVLEYNPNIYPIFTTQLVCRKIYQHHGSHMGLYPLHKAICECTIRNVRQLR